MKETTKKINSQKGGLLNSLAPLTRAALSLMKNVLTPLGKSVFVPLGLTAATLPTDAAIQKKFFGSGHPSDLTPQLTLIIPNEEMDTMKIVKFLQESSLLIKVLVQQ